MKFNQKPMKVFPDDYETLKRLSATRYANGMDKKQLAPARMLKAALRIPKIKEVLLRANIKDAI